LANNRSTEASPPPCPLHYHDALRDFGDDAHGVVISMIDMPKRDFCPQQIQDLRWIVTSSAWSARPRSAARTARQRHRDHHALALARGN